MAQPAVIIKKSGRCLDITNTTTSVVCTCDEGLDDLLVLWLSNFRNLHVFIGYKESKPTFSNIFSAFWGTLCVLISTVYIVYSTGMLLFVFSSPLWMPPAGRRAGGAELYLLSDLTYFAVRHPSLPPPWQFSLGCEFNIVKNRICIYISFFIWSGQLWKTCLYFFGRNQLQPI